MEILKLELLESKEYYIAYFDILGYKNFFDNISKEMADTIVSSIYEGISGTKRYLELLSKFGITTLIEDIKIDFIGFSDNFTFTLHVGDNQYEIYRLLSFLSIIADIQRNFAIKYGLLVRGGIVKSEAYIRENIIQGSGIIKAVNLENEAVYPQIIIDNSIYNYIHSLHFLTQKQMECIVTIQRKMNEGEALDSDEQNFITDVQDKYMWEQLALSWKDIILFRSNDEKPFLNYMYGIDIINRLQKLNMPFQEINDWFQQLNPDIPFNPPEKNYCKNSILNHQQMLIDKIRKYGNYNDLEINNESKLRLREKVIKKHIWLCLYHRYICNLYELQEYDVPAIVDVDPRVMRPIIILKEQ